MKRLALLVLFGVLSTPTNAVAQNGIPQPNSNGDFVTRTDHSTWQVTDTDPNGLNCRWSNQMPAEWADPSATLPRFDISSWTSVRRFQNGAVLSANSNPAGFVTVTDTRGRPWLKVTIGANDQICFVRANRRFIRPI
ncbi:hypothetical protein H6G00_28855 [Leptolyngbya sp. FACHB-541]|uniref:hypothetical protein n=1 Tax=Leptolyngbya sp. FACHB-541 TaxID=2692810 RepID=UPI001682124A|nr:hypothetical protein [Leptolyngbya sp. FACHB-541]MBD2000568.1 hypothetical protein [Leptolyngbya sp. FACHB-541]